MLANIPRTQPWVGQSATLTLQADQWLQALVAAVNSSPQQIGGAELVGAHASVSPTAIPLTPPATTLVPGTYRASYTTVITTAASVSSSLTVTLGWTFGGVAFSQSGAPLTSNTTTSQQNGSVVMTVDARTAVTYSLTYASSGSPAMHYQCSVVLEALP
jgi:hypothetical protein